MEKLIETLNEWSGNIKFDISQDWNKNKLEDTLDVSKLEMAIALLKQVKNTNNIPK